MEKNNKLVLIYTIVAIALVAGLYFWPNIAGYLNLDEDKGSVTFINPENGEEIDILFKEDTAVFSGLGYSQVALQQAVAASGARFVNEELDLEVWNRGSDVTVSVAGQQVFSGNIEGQTDADKLDGVWVWQATTVEGKVTEPKRPDAFKLTFEESTNTVKGTTDCNGFGGSYVTGFDNVLTFTSLQSTLMYCEGSQEQEYVNAISKVHSYYFTGSGALVLEFEGEGTMLFVK